MQIYKTNKIKNKYIIVKESKDVLLFLSVVLL